MEKGRFTGTIEGINQQFYLQESELCTFITHFGQFGDIEIYDTKKQEVLLQAKGIYINKFYPDIKNRDFAGNKAKYISHLFEDYKYQKSLKYPKGELKVNYCKLLELKLKTG